MFRSVRVWRVRGGGGNERGRGRALFMSQLSPCHRNGNVDMYMIINIRFLCSLLRNYYFYKKKDENYPI